MSVKPPDSWMFDSSGKIIKVFAESDHAHDVETKEHGPCGDVDWLICKLFELF
jgi:hypothetical protein